MDSYTIYFFEHMLDPDDGDDRGRGWYVLLEGITPAGPFKSRVEAARWAAR